MRLSLSLLTTVATTLLHLTSAVELHTIPEPQLDLSSSQDDQIAYIGNFNAYSLYKYEGQSNFTNQNNLTNNLYSVLPNNQYYTFGEVQGTINEIITISENRVLLLGDFTQIGNQNVSSPCLLNLTSSEYQSLDPNNQINGNVTTALHNDEDNLIYLGGDFTFDNTHSSVVYNLSNQSLTALPFRGFGSSSQVNSILKLSTNDNILFGGKFDSLGLPQLLSDSYNISNISIQTDQLVSLKYATLSSSNGISVGSTLSCPSSSDLWSIDGTTAGTLNIELPYIVYPSKIRVYQSTEEDHEISLFRLVTAPANGIMNLTYVDPATGDTAHCDAWCPMFNSSYLQKHGGSAVAYDQTSLATTQEYVEFGFVNYIGVTSVTFQVLNSFGSGVGIDAFQIYQSLFSTFAVNKFNEPSCASISGNYSQASTIGEGWSDSSNGNYLTNQITLNGDDVPDVGVIFYPNITYTGEYSILLYTPGCATDNTCNTRGVVNVTVLDNSSSEVLESHLIYQNNNEEKYDSIFYGHLDSAPRVEMKLYSKILPAQTEVDLVADRVTVSTIEIDPIVNKNDTIVLNGIFEYSPSNFTDFDVSRNITASDYVGNTTLNRLGSDLSKSANVQLREFNDSSLLVFGDFQSYQYGDNIFEHDLSNNETFALEGHGLNGKVNDVKVISDSGFLIAGEFNKTNNAATSSLGTAALFNGTWYGYGLTDPVQKISNVTLQESQYYIFDYHKWFVEENRWYNNNTKLAFDVTAASNDGDSSLFLGALKTADNISNKGIFLNSSSIETSDVTDQTLTHGAFNFGLYLNESTSVYGGEFVTGGNITNLIKVNYVVNETTGFNGLDWESNSSVSALFGFDDKLFIGVENQTDNVIVYDLKKDDLASEQPTGLSKSSSSSAKISQFGILNNTYLMVAGDFDSVETQSNDTCSGLCFYNLNESTWGNSIVDGLSGTVNKFVFLNSTMIAGGENLSYGNYSSLNFLQYDFNKTNDTTNQSQPSSLTSFHRGSVIDFILVDNSTTGRIIAAGDDFIYGYNGNEWNDLTSKGLIQSQSTITNIQLLKTANSTNNDETYFNKDELLFVSGDLHLERYGYANVAYYNSTSWIPYLITTNDDQQAQINYIFLNKDISQSVISGNLSNNSTASPATSSSAPATPSATPEDHNKSSKIPRGLIVLIALAMALGSVLLIGLLLAWFIFSRTSHEYTPVEPRVNETEMLDTVPPEGLLKHV